MSAPSLDSSLMGRAPLQLKVLLCTPSSSLTTPFGGVAALYLHTQGVRHCSTFRLYGAVATAYPFAVVPLLRCLLPHGPSILRGRWYMSAASTGVCLQTPFPPCTSRCRTLRRPLHSPRQFLSNTPGRVPRCLGQGPAGGRRLAFRVS